MKIALVIPRNSSDSQRSFYDYKFGMTFLLSRKYISYLLAIPTLASLTPPHHEIRVFDENIELIDYTWKADLAGITVRTMFAKRAYEISESYRARGAKTVLGGIHPSMCPDDALPHCDSVLIGEAEEIWHTVLEDAENGNLKRMYTAGKSADLTAAPIPDRSSLSKERYLLDIVQTTKGCPFHCEFCAVHAFDGQAIRNKTIEQVIREIQEINSSDATYKKKKAIFFADDNIIANKAFAKELFLALRPHNINWMCQASINISEEAELLELMRESGCGAVFIGFESICEDNLAMMHKGINRRHNYFEAIKKIQSYGILVHSSFIVGYDFDTEATFDELIGFIEEANLLMPLINILTPLPGTKLFKRLEEEGRILHKDWTEYDTQHVVFSPAGMSPDDLLQGYRRVMRSVYSFDSILTKLKYYWGRDFWKRSNEFDPVNFAYRLLFAVRLATLLISRDIDRSKFIMRILPHVFDKQVRISTILALMNHNNFAYALPVAQFKENPPETPMDNLHSGTIN
ncbi:MAG TPA: radical SAM protein [Desulfomonilaceae bacterium]|nr:radical SAM protein [Desulfomonilaceae bacterium]